MEKKSKFFSGLMSVILISNQLILPYKVIAETELSNSELVEQQVNQTGQDVLINEAVESENRNEVAPKAAFDYLKLFLDIYIDLVNDAMSKKLNEIIANQSEGIGIEVGDSITIPFSKAETVIAFKEPNTGTEEINYTYKLSNLKANNNTNGVLDIAIKDENDQLKLVVTRLKEDTNFSFEDIQLTGTVANTLKYRYYLGIPGVTWSEWTDVEKIYPGKFPSSSEVFPNINIPVEIPELIASSTLSERLEVASTVSEDELLEMIKSYIKVDSSAGEWKVTGWDENPDLSIVGETAGSVKIEDRYGQTTTVSFDFDVQKAEVLAAEAVPQTSVLGSRSFDVKKFVTNVTLNEQALAEDDYEVELIDVFPTYRAGEQTVTAKVSLRSNPAASVEVEVPMSVAWGETFVYKGWSDNNSKALSMTLHMLDKPIISSAVGLGDDTRPVHSKFEGEEYYRFDHFDFTSDTTRLLDNEQSGEHELRANGEDIIKDKISDWGNDYNHQEVNYGDVVRVWNTEAKLWLYDNQELEDSSNEIRGYQYFEITKEGYRELNFNKLDTKQVNIPFGISEIELDTYAEGTIDLKGHSDITVKGFSIAPDTSSVGKQSVKALVEETLQSGKKVQYEYEVTVVVDEPRVSLDVPSEVSFGNATLGRQGVLYWPEAKQISVENQSQQEYQLTVRLINATENFDEHLMMADQSFGNGAVDVWTGHEGDVLTASLKKENFIYVDYTNAKSVREDSGTLEWSLEPSIRKVAE